MYSPLEQEERNLLARELTRRCQLELARKHVAPALTAALKTKNHIRIGDLLINRGTTWATVVLRNTPRFPHGIRVLRYVWTGGEIDQMSSKTEDLRVALDILRKHQVLDDLAGL